jgi:hypothetical protein
MTFDEIKDKALVDLKIKKDDLVQSSVEGPLLYCQYLNEHSDAKDALSKLEIQYKKLYKDKWLYYSGKATAEVYKEKPFNLKVLKADMSIFFDSDQELIDQNYKISYMKDKIFYITKILEELSRRSFIISNCIKSNSFNNGQ